MDDDDAINLIAEIFQGYTELPFLGGSVFIRHSTVSDQAFLSALIKKQTEIIVAKGVVSEKDQLKILAEKKIWTSDDETNIAEKEDYVKTLVLTKKKASIASLKRQIQTEIDNEEKILFELKNRRAKLIDRTAEHFVSKAANEEFLRLLIYEDSGLSRLKYTKDSFCEVSPYELSELFNGYHYVSLKFSDEKIQELVLQDSFSLYLSFCDKPWDFFGKPITNLTIFQQKLIIWGRCFSNIFQNIEKIPDEIKKKPKELLEFAESSKSSQAKSSQKKEGESSFMMASAKDIESSGGSSADVGSLADELKKNGGFLDQSSVLRQCGISV